MVQNTGQQSRPTRSGGEGTAATCIFKTGDHTGPSEGRTASTAMSAAATSASPTITRSHSTRQASYEPSSVNRPTGAQSSATKPTISSLNSHRSTSRTYTHDATLPSHPVALANVARRDLETSNVGQPSSCQRSSSRDRPSESRQYHRSDSGRAHHRTHSRPGSSRNSTEMSAATTAVPNGATTPVQAENTVERPVPTSHVSSGKRRTSIQTQTGTWALGKTIGQGSMGKVKLAKNLETGEQVK